MQLGMVVKGSEFEALSPHIDFAVITPWEDSLWEFLIDIDFPYWVDLSEFTFPCWREQPIFHADAVIVQTDKLVEFENYYKLQDFRRRYPQANTIPLVWGHKKSLQKFRDYSWRIGLSWERNRDKDDHKNLHFHGFKTLDELRNFPPASMITNMPHYAVYSGVDLETRERRPQKLIKKIDRSLTKEELQGVIRNIKLIRKASEVQNGG